MHIPYDLGWPHLMFSNEYLTEEKKKKKRERKKKKEKNKGKKGLISIFFYLFYKEKD